MIWDIRNGLYYGFKLIKKKIKKKKYFSVFIKKKNGLKFFFYFLIFNRSICNFNLKGNSLFNNLNIFIIIIKILLSVLTHKNISFGTLGVEHFLIFFFLILEILSKYNLKYTIDFKK